MCARVNVSGPPRARREEKPKSWALATAPPTSAFHPFCHAPRPRDADPSFTSGLIFFHHCIPFYVQAYYITSPHDQAVDLLSITSFTARLRRYHSRPASFNHLLFTLLPTSESRQPHFTNPHLREPCPSKSITTTTRAPHHPAASTLSVDA